MNLNFAGYYVFSFLMIAVSSCVKSDGELSTQPNQDQENAFTEYIIKAHQHNSSNNIYSVITGNEIAFDAIFDSSCIYNSSSDENSGDINKLYGFSDCNTLHHQNSARVGWLWADNAIQLYAYCYAGGKRSTAYLGKAAIGEINQFRISVSSTEYIFTYKGEKTTMRRYCGAPSINGYRLYPYFGGDETAPHDIYIRIRKS